MNDGMSRNKEVEKWKKEVRNAGSGEESTKFLCTSMDG